MTSPFDSDGNHALGSRSITTASAGFNLAELVGVAL
jgi:hypothetical protein